MTFTFSAGNAHVKAGKFVKHFKFNDESETLECVPTPPKEQPFVKADQISKDSFFYTWFNSEGEDDGILAAQEALGSELYLDPIAVRDTHADKSRAGTVFSFERPSHFVSPFFFFVVCVFVCLF